MIAKQIVPVVEGGTTVSGDSLRTGAADGMLLVAKVLEEVAVRSTEEVDVVVRSESVVVVTSSRMGGSDSSVLELAS